MSLEMASFAGSRTSLLEWNILLMFHCNYGHILYYF